MKPKKWLSRRAGFEKFNKNKQKNSYFVSCYYDITNKEIVISSRMSGIKID